MTKQPMVASAAWSRRSTQSTLRLGSPGLERMLPRPEFGLRCSGCVQDHVSAIGRVSP